LSKGLSQQIAKSCHRMILSGQRRSLVDLSSALSDAGIKFVILIANQFFVEHSNSVEELSTKCTERDGLDKTLLHSDPKIGITNNKRINKNRCHQSCAEIIIRRNSNPRPANIIGAGSVEIFDAGFDIAFWIEVVAVGSNDNVAVSRPNSNIHGCRC